MADEYEPKTNEDEPRGLYIHEICPEVLKDIEELGPCVLPHTKVCGLLGL